MRLIKKFKTGYLIPDVLYSNLISIFMFLAKGKADRDGINSAGCPWMTAEKPGNSKQRSPAYAKAFYGNTGIFRTAGIIAATGRKQWRNAFLIKPDQKQKQLFHGKAAACPGASS